ncbi:MAG TPA: glycoside hydrolase family 52 protein [Ktedonobacteraceae bacterium]|nr:glycoside hydrolase family 52 protein [Ktedonobacteraceae bacterium]
MQSGTGGIYHDNAASYIVGIAPNGAHNTSIFHMGTLNSAQGDTYAQNERWTLGLDTSRWEGDASDGSGMHITVDFIDPFLGEPNCMFISDCARSVRDDTVPVLLVGVSLQNTSNKTLTGKFLFGSNRHLASDNACVRHITPGGSAVHTLSYATSADATGGTLFLAGNSSQWNCNTGVSDRAGLAWHYNVGAAQTRTSYMLIGGWNPSQNLFLNTQLPPDCQHEGLYAAKEWASENGAVDFAIDNLSTGDNLLGRAQAMEDILIRNNTLTPAQRWVIADTLRSYKADSWLVGRQACAGGGYDAAVYEGGFGFLTTVDVLYEYGYFEINRVPWFFRSELSIVFKNATHDAFGTYFQHDQGGDADTGGACAAVGKGIPTIRSTCYPSRFGGSPMPTEEDSNVALLTAYYVNLTSDTSLLTDNNYANMKLIDDGMLHNQAVGDPTTGIAYNFQDTNTSFDDQSDCLHNNRPGAGNLYYQGLKEATAYLATSFLDGYVANDNHGDSWKKDAARIENAMLREYETHGFIPLAESNAAYNNCDGRSVTLGDGLFYLHLIGQDSAMNPTLLQDLARQYPADLSADTLASPAMIVLESRRAHNPPCPRDGCPRYEWFSKVMLSGIIADLVYTQYGCSTCRHMDVTDAAFQHNVLQPQNFEDGLRDNGQDWIGHYYPRGLISWAFLNEGY